LRLQRKSTTLDILGNGKPLIKLYMSPHSCVDFFFAESYKMD